MTTVSVLISVYNDTKYIQQSLKSLSAQTLSDFECILVDDASDVDTQGAIAEYAAADGRFKIIRNDKNRGLGENLNIALAAAKGKYVARMDSDDICLPERFEKQVAYLEANPSVTVVGTWASIIDDKGNVMGARHYPVSHNEIIKIIWANPMLHPTVMMRRDALNGIGGYPSLRRKQDYALWFKAERAGWRFANIPEELLLYRVTETHFSRTKLAQAWTQLKIGFAGYARMGGCNPMAYGAMAYPFLRALLPLGVQNWLAARMRQIDPRLIKEKAI